MKIARTLAPVGYRIGVIRLLGAALRRWPGGDRQRVLQPELAREFQVRSVLAVSSGKAALTLALQALARITGRKRVVIPAYTCYSVPSSIVKAQLEVVPCDLAPGSFDYDYTRLISLLGPDVLCVLSVHLFGIPSDTDRLNELCRGTGIFVVEDAAQAFGGTSQGRRLGTLGDVGIFSLARGKNLTCGSGGVIVTNSETIAAALAEVTAPLRDATIADDAGTFAGLFVLSVFIRPGLYWLPAGLPFLRLGETIFHEDFPIRWLSNFQARLLRGWQEQLASLDRFRRENGAYYSSRIEGASAAVGVPYLRFPILLAGSDQKRQLLQGEGNLAGMSGMYPATVASIWQLAGRLPETSFPQAEAVAASLVTLPTHPLVTPEDREEICRLVNSSMLRAHDARSAS